MSKKASYLKEFQEKDGYKYYVDDIIAASKLQNCKVIKLKVTDIFLDYQAPCDNNLSSFIEHMERTLKADLSYPIVLGPDNFILDGKHRVAKAKFLGKKKIKAYRLKEMPTGFKIE